MPSDDIPASVREMEVNPQAPTCPLEDFLEAMRQDDNWWWRIACGHHLNLFEAALERMEAAEIGADEIRKMTMEEYAQRRDAALRADPPT